MKNPLHSKVLTTNTIIGTPEYMAPEMIKGEGYSYSVDYWALGVMMYEALTGILPFEINNEADPSTIYEKILKGRVYFPKSME